MFDLQLEIVLWIPSGTTMDEVFQKTDILLQHLVTLVTFYQRDPCHLTKANFVPEWAVYDGGTIGGGLASSEDLRGGLEADVREAGGDRQPRWGHRKVVRNRNGGSAVQKEAEIIIFYTHWPVWPDDQIVFSIFGHFQQLKFAQKHTNCPKVSWELWPKTK